MSSLCEVFTGVRCCQSGWIQHGEACFHFSHDKENWASAEVMSK